MPQLECGFRDTEHDNASDLLILLGPTVLVDIGFDPAVDYTVAGASPSSQTRQVLALLDTSALDCCIDDALANEIGLPVVDRARVSRVGGATDLNVYLGHIVTPALNYVQWGRFAGARLRDGGQMHSALIGQNVLQDMLVIYDGRDGRVKTACYCLTA